MLRTMATSDQPQQEVDIYILSIGVLFTGQRLVTLLRNLSAFKRCH
ncbi:unnamed protein product [Brassica oleracea]